MRDDSLTLTTTDDPPIAPAPGEVTIYPADDGDGMTRLYAVTPDGVSHALTPEPGIVPTIPALALTTAASHGPTSYVPLVTDAPVATYLGVAHRDILPGEVIECAWPQLGGVVGWMDAAILAGPATAGSPLLDRVAAVDVTASAGVTGQVAALVPVTTRIPRGTSLWFTLAAWWPPGALAPLPAVLASVFATHHAAINTIPGWRPTGIGQPAGGWPVYANARPVVATVVLPGGP